MIIFVSLSKEHETEDVRGLCVSTRIFFSLNESTTSRSEMYFVDAMSDANEEARRISTSKANKNPIFLGRGCSSGNLTRLDSSGARFGISRARFGIRERSGTSLRTKKSLGGLDGSVSEFDTVSTVFGFVFSFDTESILRES